MNKFSPQSLKEKRLAHLFGWLTLLAFLCTSCSFSASTFLNQVTWIELIDNPVVVQYPAWESHGGTRDITVMAFDEQGNLWTGGLDGVRQWNLAEEICVRHGPEHGLVGSRVSDLSVSPSGRVWVATQYGVASFYNDTWTSYALEELHLKQITSVAAGEGNTAWVSGSGVAYFDGESWTTYAEVWVEAVAIDQNGIAWSSLYGLSKFNGETWDQITIADTDIGIREIKVATDGAVWALLNEGEVLRYDVVAEKSALYDGVGVGAQWARLAVGPNGTVWVAGGNQALKWDGTGWSRSTWTEGISEITVADDGTLWYGVKGKADQVYRRSQGTILRFKIADFPPAFTSGTALTVARDNTVWAVELYSGELFHYLNLEGDEHWRPAMVYPGHPDVHNVTSTPEGRIWLGTSRGLWFTDDRNAFIRVPDVSCVSVQAWCTAPRRIWVACGYPGVLTESLIHFDGVEWEIVPVGELYEITALVEAAPNELFVGTAQGRLQHWDGDDWAQIELPRKFALSPEPISAMAVGPEGIWMGTQGNGLFFYRLSNGSLQWEHISSDDGLPSNWISSLAVGRDGSLWVGTDSGVARWKDGDWHVYTIENGLTHNRVEDIDVAPGGEVWLSTLYGGISRYSSED